jgi:hypothetical protein
MTGALRLSVAGLLAVAVSSLAIVVELSVAQYPSVELMRPSYWGGGLTFAAVVGLYVVPMGLIPGLLLHALFVRLQWRALWQYLIAASLLGGTWCVLLHAVGAFIVGIVLAAIFGTATFWLLRRPDQIRPRTVAP